MDRIPDKALSNIDINKYVKILKINNFRGCYMREEIKNLKSNNVECGVLNLNLSNESGSHWTCWYKTKTKKYYFNSFGLPPPKELVDYLGSPILYSTFQLQGMNDQNCGKWCLFILKRLNEGSDYIDLILALVK
jgi:hypothetical protein